MNVPYLFMLIIHFTSIILADEEHTKPIPSRLLVNDISSYTSHEYNKYIEEPRIEQKSPITQGVYNQYVVATKKSGSKPFCEGTCQDCGKSHWKHYPYCTDYEKSCTTGVKKKCARFSNYLPFQNGAELLVSASDVSYFKDKCVVIGDHESVKLDNCTSDSTQWSYDSNKLTIKAAGKCLDYNSKHDLQVKNCDGRDHQKWYVDNYKIQTFNKKLCVNVNHGHNGTMTAWPCEPNYFEFRGQFVTNINIDIVKKYAPIAYFDRRAHGYPMSGQKYIDDGCGTKKKECQNTILDSTSNPTYYRAFKCSPNLIKISYWWFYGYQEPCIAEEGSHLGDWEHVVVNIEGDKLKSVLYHQHSGYYTLAASKLKTSASHPKVYISKKAHGCYYNRQKNVEVPCSWFYEYRNPKDASDMLNTEKNLINLDDFDEEWIHSGDCPAGRCNVLNDIDVCNVEGCKSTGCYWKDCDDDWEVIHKKCIGL